MLMFLWNKCVIAPDSIQRFKVEHNHSRWRSHWQTWKSYYF